jgi:beta-lactam-binding protein with PASTA domain
VSATGTTSILSDAPLPAAVPVVERQELFVEPEPNMTPRILAAALGAFLVGLLGVGVWLVASGGDDADSPGGELVAGPSTTARGELQPQGSTVTLDAPTPRVAELRSAFEPVDVIDIVGLDQEDAVSELEAAGFEVNVVRQESTRSRGTVLSQEPAAGERAPFASSITIFVAVPEPPPATTSVPDVAGEDVAGATAGLQSRSLSVNTAAQQAEYSLTVTEGLVIRTSPPAGSTVNRQTSVTLVVSLGPPAVPNLVGKPAADAEAEVTALGLTFDSSTVPSLAAAGTVISSTPAAGAAVEPGSSISLVVSGGPPCTLPDLVGSPVGSVAGALTAAGCPAATISRVDSPQPPGTVLTAEFTEPTPGTVGVAVTISDDTVTCPTDLEGKREREAREAIESAGCTVGSVENRPGPEQSIGRVVSASVDGPTVNLVIGVESCRVPPVIGQRVRDARSAIEDAGCDGTVSVNPPGGGRNAIVASVSPQVGTVISTDTAITLTTDAGGAECFIPNVVGGTVAQARSAIEPDCSIEVSTQAVAADDPRAGTVIAQSVSGTVDAGTTVRVVEAVAEVPPTTGTTVVTVPTTPTVTGPTITVPTITEPTVTVPTVTGPTVTRPDPGQVG